MADDAGKCPCGREDDPKCSATRKYRTVYRRQRDLDRHPDIDPARLPLTVYSSSDNPDFQREDLAYLRSDDEPGVAEAWIETRIEHPWERVVPICSTCEDTGVVRMEGQIGTPGLGGEFLCPDCKMQSSYRADA